MGSLENDVHWNECMSSNISHINNTIGVGERSFLLHWAGPMVVIVTGLIVNSSFLLVVFRRKAMRNTTNVYLANLAIADMVLLTISCFQFLTVHSSFATQISACLFMVLATTPYYSSMLIVTQVAVDRFYTICKPIRHRATSSIRRSLKRVAVAWCCSLIYSTTLYLERILASKPCPAFVADPLQSSSGGRCDQMGALGKYSALSDVFKVLPFVFCLALNCLLYARIVKTLRDRFVLRIHRPGRQVPEWIRKIQQSRVQITKMLVVNSLVFFICNTPRSITLISGYIHDTLGVTRWDANENIEVFSGVLLVLNSCINPVIYNLTNKKYRRAFREVFLPCCSSSTSSQRMPTVFHLQISSD